MRTLGLFAIGLIFGGGIGFVAAAGMGVTFDGHDHADLAHHAAIAPHSAHEAHNELVEYGDTSGLGFSMEVTQDPVSGYNLNLRSSKFTFAPEAAGGAHVEGQGHAHVHVNGTKIARLYGNWMHIPDLPKGEVDVTVTLHANDHRAFAFDGRAVSLTQILTVE